MVPFDIDRNAFQSCMAARGYAVTRGRSLRRAFDLVAGQATSGAG